MRRAFRRGFKLAGYSTIAIFCIGAIYSQGQMIGQVLAIDKKVQEEKTDRKEAIVEVKKEVDGNEEDIEENEDKIQIERETNKEQVILIQQMQTNSATLFEAIKELREDIKNGH